MFAWEIGNRKERGDEGDRETRRGRETGERIGKAIETRDQRREGLWRNGGRDSTAERVKSRKLGRGMRIYRDSRSIVGVWIGWGGEEEEERKRREELRMIERIDRIEEDVDSTICMKDITPMCILSVFK
jgi:hypothetical protein